MIQLTTNLSDALLELIRGNEAPVDGVEMGGDRRWLRV